MVEEREIRRNAYGAIDVEYYTGRGRALQGIAVQDGVRRLVAGMAGLAIASAGRIFFTRPVPEEAESP